MERIAYILILVVLVIFMYFQVVRSRDNSQRRRAMAALAKALDCEFDIVVPEDLQRRLSSCSLGRILLCRNHFRRAEGPTAFDLVDVRYSFTIEGRRRIATSTVGRFDYDGPAFRCAPNPDPQAATAMNNGLTVATTPISLDDEAWNEHRILTGDDPDRIRSGLGTEFREMESELGETIVESDGTQVFVYRWRNRVQPDQVPALLELIARVAATLR